MFSGGVEREQWPEMGFESVWILGSRNIMK